MDHGPPLQVCLMLLIPPDDNTFFILNNNAPGFITSIYNENNNTRNIYSIVALDPADKITTAVGTVSLQDGMNIDPAKIPDPAV